MSIFDKAKELGNKVNESMTAFSSDEAIANTIMKAVEKQEKVNALLRAKGSNYRVADIELGMGIPPSVTFGVRRVDGLEQQDNSENEQNKKDIK
ncbi:MAG: hypothetical protein AAGB12_09295 [Pseudomonadota bacterium]